MEIYPPSKDSYLLVEVLKKYVKNKKIKALDMGSGSGIQAESLINIGIKKENMTIVDINPKAIVHLKTQFPKSQVIKSNLFEKVKGKFDLIVFNPPYLPENKHDKEKDTSGGKKGDETILKFLKQLKKHLNKNGRCFLLTSSLTPMERIKQEFKNYKVKQVAKKKLFYEELTAWEIY
ncbi:methyltransferase [Candidatus Pacearchaeota archaeon]|nr:methyltransferase [Candidatus Pacearchaeota archaeon]